MDIASAATGKSMGKEDFLRLFTTQLKNQDPLKPMESTEFTAQLAQFSSLEQLFNLNDGIQKMLTVQDSMSNGMTAGFIGKTVVAQDGVSGKVVGVEFGNSGASLVLSGGQKYPIGQISQIYETQI